MRYLVNQYGSNVYWHAVTRPQFFVLQLVIFVFMVLSLANPAVASYDDLDDQSGGITEGFGSWGIWDSLKEPTVEVPGQGLITVYHPDAAAAARPTVFFISGWGRQAETYEKFFDFLVSHGYTVVNIYNENPGNIEASYPNALAMMQQAATEFSPWIDTDAVGLMGHSFGGGAAIWLGKKVFGDLNWGAQGKRFIFTTAPWLTFLMTRADLEAFPSDTKLHMQISYDDVTTNPDFEWNTDPRAIRAVFELINIPDSEKDLITVHSDQVRSYEFDGNTYTYDADHYLSYTGQWSSHYEPYDELDVYAMNRLAHAMVEYVFEGNPAAKNVALGNGIAEQINMGLLPPLEVSDAPIITRDENLFLYRCSESEPGTWGDPSIWKLQEFCEDSDGDGIIDELDIPSAVEEHLAPSATAILGIGPNPFNPRTTIVFRMAAQGYASLKIYNLAGELVRTLVDENIEEGGHRMLWNGRDDRGFGLSSGSYIARLKTENTTCSQSMVLIR